MTYLRWFGNYIKTDADKVLTFVSEEEFNAWQEEVKANRKTRSVSTKTPEEQATTLAKTIKSQTKTLAAWDKKLENTELALEDEPDDADLNEYLDECGANITLLKIKLRRNKAKADTLPEATEVDEPEVDVDEDEELI
jgi:ADP-dependent phosphofructokinase/glucokinase